jgi:hypothetical protein
MYRSEFFSLWALYLEVEKMAEIRFNCLVIPNNIQADKITRQHLLTIDIGTQESVYALKSKIKKEYAPCFDDISITEFVICAVEFSSNDLGKDNNIALFLSLQNGVIGTELSPISPISSILNFTECFSRQTSKNDIYIIVYLKIKNTPIVKYNVIPVLVKLLFAILMYFRPTTGNVFFYFLNKAYITFLS